jgi:hypothetical protein
MSRAYLVGQNLYRTLALPLGKLFDGPRALVIGGSRVGTGHKTINLGLLSGSNVGVSASQVRTSPHQQVLAPQPNMDYSIPRSPVYDMEYPLEYYPTSPFYEIPQEYVSTSLPPQQQLVSFGYSQPAESMRYTPTSLGWPQGSEFVELYQFIVPKGEPPYFQLHDKWTPTYQTPPRVYLDEPK